MRDHEHKSTNTLNRREFLGLGGLIVGGLAVSPLARLFEHQTSELAGTISRVKYLGTPGLPSRSGPNPLLNQLGFSDTDRVLIIEQVDLGLCEANLAAFYELVDAGLVVSGRALVPSAWFPQVAHFARLHPQLDIGANLTLSSEWDAVCWRPLSTIEAKSGLVDELGYFPKNGVSASNSSAQAIETELMAQVRRAQGMGVHLTHLAVHQQYLLSPTFLSSYLTAAQSARLPLAFLRPDEAQWNALPGISADWLSTGMQASTQLEQQGAPLLDSIIDLSSTEPEARLAHTKQVLDNLGAGVHLITLHAAKDTPELRALTPDWNKYVADYQTWTSHELATHLKGSGIQVTHWKAILAGMPAG